MAGLGKMLLLMGIVIVIIGAGLIAAGRFGLPRLPGDITLRRGNAIFYFPIATCLIVSIILSLVLNLLVRKK